MTQAVLEQVSRMAKKLSREQEKEPGKPVRVRAAIHRDIATLAGFEGLDMGEYLSDLVEPILRERIRKMAETLSRRADDERTRRHGPAAN